MSSCSKKRDAAIQYQQFLQEEEMQQNRLKVRVLLIEGLIGFVVGFLAFVFSNISSEHEIMWGGAFAIGVFCAGIPFGWIKVGGFIGQLEYIYNIPVFIIALLIRGVIAVLIGWIAYPIALLCALIKANRQGSKRRLLFSVLLVVFVFIVALFIAVTSL